MTKKTNTTKPPAKPSGPAPWIFRPLSSRIAEQGAVLHFDAPGLVTLGRDVDAENAVKAKCEPLPSVKKYQALRTAYDRQAKLVDCDLENYRAAEQAAMLADAENIIEATDKADTARAIYADSRAKLAKIHARLADEYSAGQAEIAALVTKESTAAADRSRAAAEKAQAEALEIILPALAKWGAAKAQHARTCRNIWPSHLSVMGPLPELPEPVSEEATA